MCLVTDQKEPKIAHEDIKVYKVLKDIDGQHFSVCHPFQWLADIINTSELNKQKFENYLFNPYCDYIDSDYYEDCDKINLFVIVKGFHAFKTPERGINWIKSCDNKNMYECIIPKGSLYYEDATGLIVSNQMMLLWRAPRFRKM